MENEKKNLAALLTIPGVGYHAAVTLRKRFLSYEAAWRASPAELAMGGISQKLSETIACKKISMDPNDIMERLAKERIVFLTDNDGSFPQQLKEIPLPPQWLYIKGTIPENIPIIAIVGSRKATTYGKEAVSQIVRELADRAEVCIVSGLAVGIDEAAHRSALANNLPTIAVLGSGLDKESFFPLQNARLADDIIAKGGAVISEYPLGMPAFKQNFIQRNRIISGLALGTLIIEAKDRSGALATARFALEQGKSVMVVPGSIFSAYSRGTNNLLREGATPVVSAEDILAELGIDENIKRKYAPNPILSAETSDMLKHFDEPRTVDELARLVKYPPADILSRLSMLELQGAVKNMGGKWMRI